MSSEDDDFRTDEYWMGVRDALRMVDSFNKWSKRNPGRAKSMEDFIHDGLIAAAKRCESCLRDKLGLRFTDDEDKVDEAFHEDVTEEVMSEEVEESDEPEEAEASYEMPIDHKTPETISSEDSDETPLSLDGVARKEDGEMEDLSIEGPPREFTTDFELVEPTPLVVDEATSETSVTTGDEEDELESDTEDETASPTDEEELSEKPTFTWSDYEDAVSLKSEPVPADEKDTESVEEPEDEIEEPRGPPGIPSEYDEPPPSEEDAEAEDETEDEERTSDETQEDEEVISEPPSPPPPPETEEDEEERKRRARRLFFGA